MKSETSVVLQLKADHLEDVLAYLDNELDFVLDGISLWKRNCQAQFGNKTPDEVLSPQLQEFAAEVQSKLNQVKRTITKTITVPMKKKQLLQ